MLAIQNLSLEGIASDEHSDISIVLQFGTFNGYFMSVSRKGDSSRASRDRDSQSLTQRAYKQIEEMIVTLQLEPGEVISEPALMSQLKIGRTPIREALQRLAFEGLVVILPRRGVLVSEINHSRQLQLLELRREIERFVMREAARRSTPEERAAFSELAAHFEQSAAEDDDRAFMRYDLMFNRMTIKACRNEYAAKSMQLMQGLARRFWYQHYRQALDLNRCAKLHARVAKAISKGSAEEAANASDQLIDYMAEFTRASI